MSDRMKVVLDIGEKDCMVGVGQEGCDPQTTTIAVGEAQGLPVVLASAVRVVDAAMARWKEAMRNPAYKPAPPPKPEVKAPAKGKELSLLEDKAAAPSVDKVASVDKAPPASAEAPVGPEVTPVSASEPEAAGVTPEAVQATPPTAGPAQETAAAQPKESPLTPAPQETAGAYTPPTIHAPGPSKETAAAQPRSELRGDWVYYLKNTGKPELDGKGPFDSTLAALDALGVPQEGRGKFWHRHDRLPKKYAGQIGRRPKP